MALYLELLDWTGHQLRNDKTGNTAAHLNSILPRIGLGIQGCCDVVQQLGRIFKLAAGTPESLVAEAYRRGQGCPCAGENPLGLWPV